MEETMMSPGGGESPHDDGRPQLARRNDTVGQLAWRLVGDSENPPDPTAAPLLLDAMEAYGFPRSALFRLRDQLIREARRFAHVENRTASVRHAMDRWQEEVMGLLTPLLWDFDSALALTGWAVDRCRAAPPAVETGSVTVNVVWADIGRVGIGERVTLDDGRRGTVVLDTRPDGKSGVALHNEQETGDGMPAQAYASDSRPRRRW